MNYCLNIKDNLKNHIEFAIQLLLLIVVVYVFILAEDYRLWKIPLLFVGLFSWFFFSNKTKHPIIWIVLFLLLSVDLFHAYFWVANHHFMMMFMVLSVLFYNYHKRIEILLKNIKLVLFIVVIASAFQKLMSSQFISGNFYYYMVNRGSMFKIFINFFPESLEVVKSNAESLSALHKTDPNLAQNIEIKDVFPNLSLISQIFAWITIIVECIVAISILVKPKRIWTHLFLIAMILGVLCIRLETGFMALLALSGLFLCNNLKLRLVYIMIFIGCITLIVTKVGYH